MDQTMVNRAERPSGRKRFDAALVVAACVVLLFAIVGVVSAGSFVAGKVSGSSAKSAATPKPATTSALAAQDIHRAQEQATAIVRQAQSAGHSIVTSANAKAHRQASAMIATARHQVSSLRSSVAAAPVPASTAVPNTGTSVGSTTTGGVASGVSQSPTSSIGAAGSTGGLVTGTSTGSVSRASVPDLRGLPLTWLVVGYNATFANGSGSVGSISVVNRSGKTFRGVAVVKYKTGGSASSSFSGLAPGQALVFPLSGSPYPGGGYTIVMSGLH